MTAQGVKRTPAEACEQAAEMYDAIAGDEQDSVARTTAKLLRKAADECRAPRGERAPAELPVVSAPQPVTASKLGRLIRAAKNCLPLVRTAGTGEVYRDELEAALEPFLPKPAARPAPRVAPLEAVDDEAAHA